MALSRDAYRELEDIVGPENIAEDPVIIDTYAFAGEHSYALVFGREYRYLVRPEAVVLPGSTEEVQAVIKLCNRRGIYSKASSTGYGYHNGVCRERTIMLDLRRMNRILEIDEKNMYIVVEPYVCFAQVQAEAHKRGLNCHVIGAGANCSFLASHTSHGGGNAMDMSQASSGRNLLGVEWVLPTGDILRVGSPGSGVGWFTGDGPGPSLRGILRGALGMDGGLGVFTKCAAHLHPWPGPPKMEITGISPYYETEVPPLFEYHMIDWPSPEQCADAMYKIGEAGIAFMLYTTAGPGSHGGTVTGSNNEFYEKWDQLKDLSELSFATVLAASSPGEHEYQVRVLDKILEDTGGRILPVGELPIMKNRDYINMIKMCFIPRTAFRLTGNFFENGVAGGDSADNAVTALELDHSLRGEWVEKGYIMDDGTNNSWMVSGEGGHTHFFGGNHFFDITDEESCIRLRQMYQQGLEVSKTIGHYRAGLGEDPEKVLGPLRFNYMRKVKKTFDPNAISDPQSYISAEEA